MTSSGTELIIHISKFFGADEQCAQASLHEVEPVSVTMKNGGIGPLTQNSNAETKPD